MDIQKPGNNQNRITETTFNSLEGLEIELQEEMTREELNDLVSRLSKISTALPDDRLISETMKRLQNKNIDLELPNQISPSEEKKHRVGILMILKVVISHINLAFLWQGLVFYLAGFFLLNNATNLPKVFIFSVISAIPFLLGVISMMHWFANGIAELMMSLKFKLVWYVNASFLLTGIYCLIINMLFSLIFPYSDMKFGELVLHWCIPSIVIASIAVWLCARVKDFLTLVGCFIALPILCMLFYGNQTIQKLLMGLNIDSLLILFVIAITLLILTVFGTTHYIRNGGMIHGTDT